MTKRNNQKIQNIELLNVTSDFSFFFYLMMGLRKTDYLSIIISNLVPYLSMFIVESMKWINNNYPKESKEIRINHKNIIFSSRNRRKFLDDRGASIENKIDFIKFIIQSQYEVSNHKHTGLLGFIKRQLQDDLGLTLYENQIISSTFTGMVNLGYSEEELTMSPSEFNKSIRELSKSVGYDIGQYLGSLLFILSIKKLDFITLQSISKSDFNYYDVKAKKFLPEIFPMINSEPLSLYLLYFLSELNSVTMLDSLLREGDHLTMLKIKYVTLFHVASSIKKLRDYAFLRGIIDRFSSQLLSNTIKQSDIQLLTRQAKFRNALIHYKIMDIPETKIDRDIPLYGFVEYFFPGMTYHDLDRSVNTCLSLLSKSLTELMNWAPSQWRIYRY